VEDRNSTKGKQVTETVITVNLGRGNCWVHVNGELYSLGMFGQWSAKRTARRLAKAQGLKRQPVNDPPFKYGYEMHIPIVTYK
jgi:hypothetical protein